MKKSILSIIVLIFIICGQESLFAQTTMRDLGNFADQENILPSTICYTAVYGNYLYLAGDAKIYIYDISNPAKPDFIKTVSHPYVTGVWAGSGILAAYADYDNQIAVYDISSPSNPVKKSDYNAGADLRQVSFRTNYMYVLYMHETNKLGAFEIVDVSNLTSPILKDTYTPGDIDGLSFCFSPDSNKVYTAHYNYGINKTVVHELDITNPANIKNLRQFTTSKMTHKIKLEDEILYLLKSNSWQGPSYITAFDIYSGTDWIELASQQVSTDMAQDMHVFGNSLTLTLMDGGIKDYTYDKATKTFTAGTSIAYNKSSLMSWHKSSYTSQSVLNKKLSKSAALAGEWYRFIYYATNNIGEESHPYGTMVKIVEKIVKKVSNKAILTMAIDPAQAVDKGCSVSPSPGKHEYVKGSTAQLSATDNTTDGWVFKEWTGAASGSNKQTSVLMDDDKSVTGVFKELKLVVAGSKTETICTCDADNQEKWMTTLSATAYGDDWVMTGISLEASQNGDDKGDVTLIVVKSAGKLWEGVYPVDNGNVTANFPNPITIAEGQTVVFTIHYTFGFEQDDLNSNQVILFKVTGNALAKPKHYESGPIVGKATGKKYLGLVFNTAGVAFIKINDAISDATTLNGHEVILCPGLFKENVSVSKELTIRSLKGKEVTIVDAATEEGLKLPGSVFDVKKNNTTIKDLIIRNSWVGIQGKNLSNFTVDNCNVVYNVYQGIDLENINTGEIKNCIFTKTTNLLCSALDVKNAQSFKVHHSTFTDNYRAIKARGKFVNTQFYSNNINLAKDEGILLWQAEECVVTGNTLQDCSSYGINLVGGKKHDISNNIIKGGVTTNLLSNGIRLYETDGANIEGNTIDNTGWGGITATNSKNFSIFENKSYGSVNAGIKIDSCFNFEIERNQCWNNRWGVKISGSEKFNVINNRLSNNTIRISHFGGDGIYLNGKNTKGWILDNYLKNNCTGIKLADDYSKITLHGNFVMDCFCFLTGIHMSGGEAEISGNYLSGNQGAAIMAENGARANVSFNNFINNDKAIINKDVNTTITANNNYWGGSQPGEGDYSGNVSVTNWLSNPVSLVSQFNADTVFVKTSQSDSLTLAVQNLDDKENEIQVTISDEKGWIQGDNVRTAKMTDTTAAIFKVSYTVPSGITAGTANLIRAQVISTKHQGVTAKDSVFLVNYTSVINKILLSPDSTTVKQGDSLQLSVAAYDDKNNPAEFTPQWTVSAGTISESGLYNSTGASGVVTITANHQALGTTASVKVYVSTTDPVLTKIKINPSSVTINAGESQLFTATCYSQFNFKMDYYCVWSATDGSITKNGLFITDKNTKSCIVKASDSTGVVFAISNVTIVITSIEDKEIIPDKFRLEQNYPNPFNPTTTIRFGLPVRSAVKIEVYNILGQRVTRLVNEVKDAGYHEVVWNTNGLSSGVYFYSIDAKGEGKNQEFRAIKKMLMIK